MRTSVRSEAGWPASGDVCQKSVSGATPRHAASSITLPSRLGACGTLTALADGLASGAWAEADVAKKDARIAVSTNSRSNDMEPTVYNTTSLHHGHSVLRGLSGRVRQGVENVESTITGT